MELTQNLVATPAGRVRRHSWLEPVALVTALLLASFFLVEWKRSRANGIELLPATISMPPIVAQRLDGSVETVSFEAHSRPAIVVFVSMRDEASIANFREVAQQAQGRFRVVAVALDGPVQQWAAMDPGMLVKPSAATIEAWRMRRGPATILVLPDSRIVRTYHGAKSPSPMLPAAIRQ